jgi:TRAP-type C4-dicarboxylate transport system permease large subunit
METIAAITILTPVLLPVAMQLGIDPIHFGVIMVLNLMIGLLTPPVGMVLFVLTRVAKVSFERAAKATFPFLLPLLIVLFLITYFEPLCMWLPGVLFAK